MADWVAISSLATGGGTLALAATTYASVRSANRAARVAEAALLADVRPLLVESSESDEALRVHFYDISGIFVPGGRVAIELVDDNVYVVISLRNVGRGIAVLYGGVVRASREEAATAPAPIDDFRLLSRDIYIPPAGVGFWQIAWRGSGKEGPAPPEVLQAIENGELIFEILYGDFEGGQRIVTTFRALREEDGAWHAATVRHWQLDRAPIRPQG